MRAMAGFLAPASEIPPEAFALVESVRDLVEATVMTDVPATERAAIQAEIEALTRRLAVAERPDAVWMVKHTVGGLENADFEHLTQAGNGRLNPQAPRLQWLTPDGEVSYLAMAHPETGEVLARCILGRQHVGPPERAHGGVVATILDHVVGFATAVVQKPGMTAGLDIRYKGPTPYGVPLMVHARYTHSEGRKHFATGEIRADGVITASALGVFIGHPQWSESQ
jgi:acyl-coenzyme A thioesterase PaaI-like protein